MERRATRKKSPATETDVKNPPVYKVGMRGVGRNLVRSGILPIERAQKEIPMLYSSEMVRALKIDVKTETRRTRNLQEVNEKPDNWFFATFSTHKKEHYAHFLPCTRKGIGKKGPGKIIKCPYGQPGDLIWVREAFSPFNRTVYRADFTEERLKISAKGGGFDPVPRVWTPSIHMPKGAARIWLQIESVHIERLNFISRPSAVAEGIGVVDKLDGIGIFKDYKHERGRFIDPILSYKSLWDSINGAGSWDKNPWVWVVKFKKVNAPKHEQF